MLRSIRLIGISAAVCVGLLVQPIAVNALTTDLSPTPPDLTTSVDPNIVVTFDDSGSTAWSFMGDAPPYATLTPPEYYPIAGQTWDSGPWHCAGTIDPRITDPANPRSRAMNGVYYNPNIVYSPPIRDDGTTFPNADATLRAVWNDGITQNRPTSPSSSGTTDMTGVRVSARTDRRWTCTSWSTIDDNPHGWARDTNPFSPNGGPYYYRFKSSSTLLVDARGNPVPTSLYVASNWEAVQVPAAEYQNFANWFAYYRNRNMMMRTVLSRVYGSLGQNLRVAWQNLNNATYQLPASTIITGISNTNPLAPNYRHTFFDWIFQVAPDGITPNRLSTIRASRFFERPNTGNLRDPYWEPGTGGAPGQELSCRQNFHMLVTDGYWNENSPATPAGFVDVQGTPTLGDGTTVFTHTPQNRVFWNVPASPAGTCTDSTAEFDAGAVRCYPSLADIGFNYWAHDLRPDLPNNVPAYFPDKSTSLFGVPLMPGAAPESNAEIYWNPANDPATWQHVVQFMISLGVDGLRFYPADYAGLRSGSIAWPQPARTSPPGIDDTWHAAVNSRGSYFSATNPAALVTYLSNILNTILARRTSATALSPTVSVLTAGSNAFQAGYDSGDWSGQLVRNTLDPVTGAPVGTASWDAGCVLTGGACTTAASSGTVRDPNTRVIYTWNGTTGTPFTWAGLNSTQQTALNIAPATGAADANGPLRVQYLRGDRTNETVAPVMRRRGSVLGAIVNSQVVYVSAPTGGFSDSFPAGSPEAMAAASGTTYSQFVYNNRARAPTIYVGSNDGMMHAFNADDGTERWAYVPNMLFGNGKLDKLTDASITSEIPTVDDTVVVQDVFISGAWHTVLVGTMRLGGRGVFALDITDPTTFSASKVLWEFSNLSAGGANLGYTFSSANIARLNSGRWVVLLSSGYYPKDPTDPASTETAHANQTSLFVIDLTTGALIREIPTSAATQFASAGGVSFGLGTPAGYDLQSDQVDDIAVAGDLAGNLWRFDLSSASSASWTVDLMFKDYTTAPTTVSPAPQPITVMPVAMRDPVAGTPIWIFGTGKYLGQEDRTSTGTPSNVGPQSFYGIRDYGTHSTNYPIAVSQLVAQTLSQSGSVRSATSNPVPVANRGWRMTLAVGEAGERNIITALPLYSSNRVVLTTLVPLGTDPCAPGRRGAIMVLDAAGGGAPTGTAPISGGMPPAGSTNVGAVVTSTSIPLSGFPTLIGRQGGGAILLPGIPSITISDPPYHRGAWRELLDPI